MLRYEIYRPKVPMTAVETEKFLDGEALADIMGGNYHNVSHIASFNNFVKGCAQILVREQVPGYDENDENDIFPGINGTVVLVKGICQNG